MCESEGVSSSTDASKILHLMIESESSEMYFANYNYR